MKTYKKYLLILSFLATVVMAASAQKEWSLDECIGHALQNNLDIKSYKTALERQEIQVEMEKNNRLPALSGSLLQSFNFGRVDGENGYSDGRSQVAQGSLSAEMPLFTGLKIPNSIAKSKLDLQAGTANLDKRENDIALQVATYYYQILLNKEILVIAREQLALSNDLGEVTRTMVEHGKVPESQILDVQAQISNDEVKTVVAENNLRLSRIDLAQLMELDEIEHFDIKEVELDIILQLLRSPGTVYNEAVEIMPEVKSALYTIGSREKAVKIARSGYYPTLSLGAEIYTDYYHYNKMENATFSSQIKDRLRKTILLNLQIPLFNRFNTRNAVRIAKKELDESRFAADNVRKTLFKEIQKTYYDAMAAREKYESTQKAVVASQEAMRYAREKYNSGKSTAYEFNESKVKLIESLSEQAQAKYEFILQKYLLDFYAGNPIK